MAKKREKIDTSDHQMLLTASAIREHYTRRKAAALGSHYKPSPRHNKHEYWVNAAKQCLRLEASPEDYVDAAFRHSGQRSGPFPNALAGAAAERWYREYARNKTDHETTVDGKPSAMADVAEAELITGLNQIRLFLHHRTGNGRDMQTPDNLASLRMRIIPLWDPGRALLGYPDPAVLREFGLIAYKHFMEHPAQRVAARKLNLPIDEMIKWIQTHILKA